MPESMFEILASALSNYRVSNEGDPRRRKAAKSDHDTCPD